MKKRLITVFLSLLFAFSVLAGCSTEQFDIAGEKQDTTYAVIGNGGNSVQYGNYVYFINGSRGYSDDGNDNKFGNVVKGAVYRAKLNGEKVEGELNALFDVTADANGSEFVTKKGADYYNNEIDYVDVTRVVPKVVGTSGYTEGGIYIFDNWLYYATPNNTKNKQGTVQTSKTDFARINLSTGEVDAIYTTSGDSSSGKYSFSKFGDKVYLTCHFGTTLVTVACGNAKGKIDDEKTYKNVEDVILPYRANYYSKQSNKVRGLEDYVFILRSATDADAQRTGKVIEMLSPDGKEKANVVMQGKDTDALETVNNGKLFYRTTDASGNGKIVADNLHEVMMQYAPSYKSYQESLSDTDAKKITQQIRKDVVSGITFSDVTDSYCFAADGVNADIVYALIVSATSVTLHRNATTFNAQVVLGESIKGITFIKDDYMYYYVGDDGILYRSTWEAEGEKQQISHGKVYDNGLRADYCAGYVVYMGTYEWATDKTVDGYTFFRKVELEGADETFVGEFISADVMSVDDEEETDDSDSSTEAE